MGNLCETPFGRRYGDTPVDSSGCLSRCIPPSLRRVVIGHSLTPKDGCRDSHSVELSSKNRVTSTVY